MTKVEFNHIGIVQMKGTTEEFTLVQLNSERWVQLHMQP